MMTNEIMSAINTMKMDWEEMEHLSKACKVSPEEIEKTRKSNIDNVVAFYGEEYRLIIENAFGLKIKVSK